MADPKPRSKVASLDPDTFVQGGLPDDFDGHMSLRFVPWTFPDGSVGNYMFAGKVSFVPEEESGIEPFFEYYGAGGKSLSNFVPSMDGDTPAGATLEEYHALATGNAEIDKDAEDSMQGIFPLRVGKVEGINSNSKLAEFIGAVQEIIKSSSQAQLQAAGWTGWGNGSSECLDLYGHFNRIPTKDRGFNRQEGKPKPTILVMTELKPRPAGSGAKPTAVAAKSAAAVDTTATPTAAAQTVTAAAPATASVSAATASVSAAAGVNGDLRTRLADKLPAILAEKGVQDATTGLRSLPKAKLPALVMGLFDGPERGEAIKTVAESAFLGSDLADGRWLFDPATGMVMAIPA